MRGSFWRDLTATLVLAFIPARAASSALRSPAELIKRIGFDQTRLGAELPLDARLTDEDGRPTSLRKLLGGKPAVLALVYYDCPMLCTLTLNGMVRALRVLSISPGRDFSVISLSINPWETPGLARDKRRSYLEVYRRPRADAGWHFLVAPARSIAAVTSAAGFKYVYDAGSKQFAHAPGLILVTPDGRVSQYLPGIEFDANAIRLGLVQASQGKLGTVLDRAILLCYQYDPATGRYSLAILKTLKVLAVLTLALMAGGVAWLVRSTGTVS